MNDYPIRFSLKPEDSAPLDPQATAIELAELVTAHVEELEWVRDLMTRWGTAPVDVCQRVQPRLVDLHRQAGAIRDLLETLSQGHRASGAFSSTYGRGA